MWLLIVTATTKNKNKTNNKTKGINSRKSLLSGNPSLFYRPIDYIWFWIYFNEYIVLAILLDMPKTARMLNLVEIIKLLIVCRVTKKMEW